MTGNAQQPTDDISKRFSGRNVVVTGGAGFVGSHLAEALVTANANVVVADSLASGSLANLSRMNQPHFVNTTLGDDDELARVMVDAEFVFHCAANAYVPPSVKDPMYDFELNLRLPLRILEWCRLKSPLTRVLLFSSGAIYGNPRYVPMDEEHPTAPISPYGVSKLAADRYGAVYAQLYSLQVASLRCFPVYGPRQRKQVVYDLMQRMKAGKGRVTVLGDGTQVRDFCFVEDMARAAMTIAAVAPLEGEAWNAGGGEGVSIQELVVRIGRALKLEAQATFTGKVRPGDPEAMVADISRLRQLGWSPMVGIDEGLARTATWLDQDEVPVEQ